MKKILCSFATVRFPLLSCLLTLAASLPALAQEGLSSEAQRVLQSFENELANGVERDGIGSITAAVVFGDTVVWSKSFGWADSQKRRLATPENIYRIGSISKPITATVLVQLAETGVLNLDDPVVKYVPEIRQLAGTHEGAEHITLRQLASHRAGLAREPDLSDAASGPIEAWEQKVLASIPSTSLMGTPGGQFSYSNIGYGILGLAMSRAADKPFVDLVEDLLFTPLDMDQSEFVLSPEQQQLLAVGYANSQEAILEVNMALPAQEHAGRGYKVPNGGVYSTVEDLAKFIAAQAGAVPFLSDSTRAELHRFYTGEENEHERAGYGLGFNLWSSKDDESRWIYHLGGVAGYSAALFCELESRIGILLLRNYNQGSIDLYGSADALMWQLIEAR